MLFLFLSVSTPSTVRLCQHISSSAAVDVDRRPKGMDEERPEAAAESTGPRQAGTPAAQLLRPNVQGNG